MAYSMLECPKFHNTESLKFYPEEYDHQVSLRHKNLPPGFDLANEGGRNRPLEGRRSSRHECPIYVHRFEPIRCNEGDFVKSRGKKTKSKKKSSVMQKLEETYWANWKPDKNSGKGAVASVKGAKAPEIQIIKSAPLRKHKIKVYPPPEEIDQDKLDGKDRVKQIQNRSREIQTEEVPEQPDTAGAPASNDAVSVTEEASQNKASEQIPPSSCSEEILDNKFLKHTDSFVLNIKKQKEDKERFDQPRCIRLYRKTGKMASKNFVKGGSYPLKSCLKPESTLTKGSSKLNRPGSPIITSSNFSSKIKTYRRQHKF